MLKSTWAAFSVVSLIGAAVGYGVGSRMGRTAALEQQVTVLAGEVAQLRARTINGATAVNEQLARLHDELRASDANLDVVEKGNASSNDDREGLRSLAEANEEIKKLVGAVSAERISETLARLDTWLVRPEDEKALTTLKLQQAARLRQCVKEEVVALQKAALDASTGAEGAKRHAEAGRILSLYPMSDDKSVLDEAKALSAKQMEVANRIEVIRRQRYNHWAADRVAAAIDAYNKTSSYRHPLAENPKLTEAMVLNLGDIDPAVIEPAVLELYTYVMDLTKGSLNEQWKTELARRLTDPSIQRKTLGDF